MRIVQIDVERLLGFKRLSVEVDPQLQLIAGPNNAGKSSLIRVLELFFAKPSSADIQALKPLNDYYLSGGPRMLSSIEVTFGDLSEMELDLFADAISPEGQFSIKISCTRKGAISYRTQREAANAEDVYDRVLQSFSFVKIPSVRVNDPTQRDGDQSLARLYETLEGVLIRTGSSRTTQLQRDFAEAMAPVEKLVHSVLSESMSAVASELPFREGNLGIKLPDSRHALGGMLQEAVITSRDEVEVSIAQRGTGFQSALVLGILRYVSSRSSQPGTNVVFAVEEPEAFLHPQTQRAMAKILLEISTNAQLLVTTHSPVLVDSFSVSRIVRLPMNPAGLDFTSRRSIFSEADEGRLTRYCDATNSEMVFANAVVLVEGHGDKLLVDYMLERITGGPGGHYAVGITVIEASGIDTIRYLVQLAQLFAVRVYVMTDKDGVHKSNPKAKRALMQILNVKNPKPQHDEASQIGALADENVRNLTAALAQQSAINEKLQKWDAFVLSSDLEGLLLDSISQKSLAELLGPDGRDHVDRAAAEKFATGVAGREAMASWLGSKGWNSNRKTSAKAKPHVPSALLRDHIGSAKSLPRALRPLGTWLGAIVAEHQRSPL